MKYYSILKQVELNTDGLNIVEMFNNNDGTFEYYLYSIGYPLIFTFGVPDYERLNKKDLIKLYESGYFTEFIPE